MYRQILVAPEHRKYQRILWRFSSEDPVSIYALNTVTFGVVSAPYLAQRTLKQLTDEEKDFPLASNIVRESTYVDDILGASDSLDEALFIRNQLICLLKKGGFELRKWLSNERSLLSDLPEEHVYTGCPLINGTQQNHIFLMSKY
ncbi:hypothetical protein NQ317_003309 [Molorchus minor]|uniref:Reverse transcriptase domain-containing protein n=1 Tax=Molorchus minor TaxID=1323400 RepID=A0ABQ9IQH6_9CUCU|nr:hypothetical protein NQ317_003309 [Molorchus minor]